MRPEVKKLIDWATQPANGWTNQGMGGGGHYRLRHESGAEVTVSGSPSDWRTILNTYRDIARATGQRPPKSNAARYRRGVGRRHPRFDMDAAVRDQAARRAVADLRAEIARQRADRIDALHREHGQCLTRLAQIDGQVSRRGAGDPERQRALRLIARCLDIEADCEALGAPVVVPVENI